MFRRSRNPATAGATLLVGLASLITGCAGTGDAKAPSQREAFDSTSVHSRVFAASTAETCEAARRALLSQGYVANIATPEQVNGRKNFQPDSEVHLEVEFRVVCAPDVVAGAKPGHGASAPVSTIAFVSALQERYALKKSNNSASLGVGVLGSVSLPFSSSDDALVKVASETLGGGDFYDRFFRLMARYLPSPGVDAVDVGVAAASPAAPAPAPAARGPAPPPAALPAPAAPTLPISPAMPPAMPPAMSPSAPAPAASAPEAPPSPVAAPPAASAPASAPP